MKLKKEMAEAIVNDMILDDGEQAECISCSSFGNYPNNINHTDSCIVLKARKFLREVGE